MESFEHINLNDIDDSRKPIDANVYTLEVNRLNSVYKEVKNPDSPYLGQKLLVLQGSYTVVDDPKFAGRKLWKDFWTPFKIAQVQLKKQMSATGVLQTEGQSLIEYAEQFGILNPPARFQVPINLVKDRRDPEGPEISEINFFQAKPAV